MKKLYFIFCLGVLMVSAQMNVFGQILAWDFYTANVTGSTYNDPNIEAATLVRGVGAPVGGGYTTGFSIRFTNEATDYNSAKAKQAYIELKVKVKSGFKVSLEGLDAKIRSTAEQNGAKYFSWAYWVKNASDDNEDLLGTNFVRIGNVDNPFPNFATGNDTAFPFPTIDLTNISGLQNVDNGKEIVFRIYGWGALGGTSNNTTAFGKSGSAKGSISLMLRGLTSVSNVTLTKDEAIAKWNFNLSSSSSNPAVSPINAQNRTSDLSVFNLKRGGGLTAAVSQRAFVSKLTNVASSLADAEQRDEYYEIELKVGDVNKFLSLSSLMFRYIREIAADGITELGPDNYIWKYSIDEGNTFTNITSSTFPANIPDDGVDLYLDLQSIAGLRDVKGKTILLRMYTWGGSVGFFGFGKFNHTSTDFSSIIIKGQVTDQPLPVKLTSFKAIKAANGIKLNWKTASEENNSHFEVYKSAIGKPDIFVGSQNGAGNSTQVNNYSLTDYEPFIGTNYYQLRQVDIDGQYQESAIISIKNTLETEDVIKVYQKESSIELRLHSTEGDRGTLQIVDVTGRMIYKKEVSLSTGDNKLELPFSSSSGVYIINLITDNGTVGTKFIW